MKSIILLICISISLSAFSQYKFIGNWEGKMKTPQGSELIFVMKVKKDKNKPIEFYCPSLGIKDIVLDEPKIKEDTIFFNIPEMNGKFGGKLLNDTTIEAVFIQSIFKSPFTLYKKEKVTEINRLQEPQPPFSYIVSEVKFENKEAGILLAGTLTMPKKDSYKAPCVILVTGSGPQNRDEEIMGHKPFLVLSDYFTRNGIAVLRYDDRGFAESEGDHTAATSEDFASDLKAAVKFLRNHKGINTAQIGLAGHSEGGIIAGIVAADNPDIAFVIAMAGPSVSGDIILQEQTKLIFGKNNVNPATIKKTLKATKKIHNHIKKSDDDKLLVKRINKEYKKLFKKLSPEDLENIGVSQATVNILVYQLISPWFKYFVRYNPESHYSKLKCPFLWINGEEDIQVPALINKEGFEKIFAESGKKNYELKIFPGLNHLFQNCKTCDIMEYGILEETFNEEAMKFMASWILEQSKQASIKN